MYQTALRANDFIQLAAEPLTPFMVGASEIIVDAELADDRPGEVEQAKRLAEYEGRNERIGCAFANIEGAGPRHVVGAELCFPRGRDDVLGDIDPVVGILAIGTHECTGRAEAIGFRNLSRPNGQVIPCSPDEGMARLDFDNVAQQDTLQLCRVWQPCSNVWGWRMRSLVSLLRHV